MWLLLLLIILPLLYYLGQKNYDYWKRKGVPGPKPTWFVGNVGKSLVGIKSLDDILREIYREYAEYPFVGIYRIGTPCLLARDLDFIKDILIKDFKNFHDNDIHIDKEVDKIGGRNPFNLKGMEWKQKRAALTSCFTSGKIKGMFPIFKEVSQRMIKYIETSIDNSKSCMESREVCVRYTLDNIAACAFGLEGKCFDQEYSEFRKLADDFMSPGMIKMMCFMILTMFPTLSSYLKIGFLSKEVENKLIAMVTSTIKYRKEHNISRNDFLNYVTDITKDSDLFKDDIDITAQAATFFADGYETSSRVMSFVVFELAKHPEIQKKLRNEIKTVCSKYKNQLTYDAIQEMTYLDACFYESMRNNVLVGQIGKVCTERYTYTPTNPDYKKISITVEPGTVVMVPIGHVAKDSTHFDNPDEYRPERFMDKENISKAFMPFSEGPRSCLGMRFAQTQIKLGVAELVRNFEMTVNPKTKLPLKFDPWYFLLSPIGGLWIDFKKIEQ